MICFLFAAMLTACLIVTGFYFIYEMEGILYIVGHLIGPFVVGFLLAKAFNPFE